MVTLEQAQQILVGAKVKGQELGMKPLSTAVVDSGGHLIAFEREDGASPGRFDIARGKAYGCVMLSLPGSAQMARAESQAYFMAAVNGVYGGKVIPIPGGVLLRDDGGRVIGAVGVTGDTPDNDAIAALAGVAAAGLRGEA